MPLFGPIEAPSNRPLSAAALRRPVEDSHGILREDVFRARLAALDLSRELKREQTFVSIQLTVAKALASIPKIEKHREAVPIILDATPGSGTLYRQLLLPISKMAERTLLRKAMAIRARSDTNMTDAFVPAALEFAKAVDAGAYISIGFSVADALIDELPKMTKWQREELYRFLDRAPEIAFCFGRSLSSKNWWMFLGFEGVHLSDAIRDEVHKFISRNLQARAGYGDGTEDEYRRATEAHRF